MKKRTLTGFFFVLVMLASILSGVYVFSVFFFLLSVLCLYEFYELISSEEIKPWRSGGMLLSLSIYISVVWYFLFSNYQHYLLLMIPAGLLVYIVELFRKKDNPFHNIAYTLIGVIYLVLPFCFFYAIAFHDKTYNYHYPLGLLFLLWANDTGAYLVGVKWGRHRLFERHSPKKSWEGFIGGLITSLIIAFILSRLFKELTFLHWASIAVITAVFGTLGDLTESMLKRSLGKKDSGNILPGHGGVLDRFDGLFFTSPIIFLYLHLVTCS